MNSAEKNSREQALHKLAHEVLLAERISILTEEQLVASTRVKFYRALDGGTAHREAVNHAQRRMEKVIKHALWVSTLSGIVHGRITDLIRCAGGIPTPMEQWKQETCDAVALVLSLIGDGKSPARAVEQMMVAMQSKVENHVWAFSHSSALRTSCERYLRRLRIRQSHIQIMPFLKDAASAMLERVNRGEERQHALREETHWLYVALGEHCLRHGLVQRLRDRKIISRSTIREPFLSQAHAEVKSRFADSIQRGVDPAVAFHAAIESAIEHFPDLVRLDRAVKSPVTQDTRPPERPDKRTWKSGHRAQNSRDVRFWS